MLKRLFWLGLGAAIGVLVFRKLGRAQKNLGPGGINRAVGRLNDSLDGFVSAFRENMDSREAELKDALGIAHIENDAPSGGRHAK